MLTPTLTLITALRILSQDIQSGDGVANACIAEAADRIETMAATIEALQQDLDFARNGWESACAALNDIDPTNEEAA